MRKLLQINPVLRTTTSTGRIMQEIGDLAISCGWESFVAYSRGRDGIKSCSSIIVPIGNKLDVFLHFVATRLFDRHGLASRCATKLFIRKVKKIDPDIIHIHNIHGYFLNFKILFKYLAECGKPVVWTVHDCWLFTGHCYHYSSAGCYRWQDHCRRCPQKRSFPASFLLDRSERNFRDKRAAFNSVTNLTIVSVSDWMRREMSHSFLSGHDFKVIHNGIDLDDFKPSLAVETKEKYRIGDSHVILGVASIWSKEKGLDDFYCLSSLLPDDCRIVLVGALPEEYSNRIPSKIIHVKRTGNVRELAALYSMADVLFNATWQDNYPTVNMEAIACGTPVITYRTGGSVESVVEDTGFVVDQGDLEGVLKCFSIIRQKGRENYISICRKYAMAHFDKKDRYEDYIKLYENLTTR